MGPTLCACGYDLGQAESEAAPTEAALITQRLVAALTETAESDLLTSQLFCADVRRMTALEWLAVFNFLASAARPSYCFYPPVKGGLDFEKEATLIAARIFVKWPDNALAEFNSRWQKGTTSSIACPFISSRQLRERAAIRHVSRLRGALKLPVFMSDVIEQYVNALTVHSRGQGLAVNPDRVIFRTGGLPVVEIRQSPCNGGTPVLADDLNCVPLPRLMEGIRQSNIVLHDLRQVERLIRATEHQRIVLARGGFFRPIDGGRLVLSSEMDRFRRWLQRVGLLSPQMRDVVPLSALSRRQGTLLQQVLTAVESGAAQLYRISENSTRLDRCFVAMRSIVELSGRH